MAKISGYLKDGAGQAVAECIIILSALKTSNQVIEQIESYTTTKDGFYEINALTGQYEVTLSIVGHPPKKVGVITVYNDSVDGTLNDFLANGIDDNDITPLLLSQLIAERKQAQAAAQAAQKSVTDASSTLANMVDIILAQVTDERQKAQDAAQAAEKSVTDASSTLANVVKKTGDTMNNGLKILSNTNSSIEIGNAEGSDSYIINRLSDGKFAHRIKGTNGYLNRLIFEPTKNTWNFVNSYLTIDNNLVLKQGDYGLGGNAYQPDEFNLNDISLNKNSGFYQIKAECTGQPYYKAFGMLQRLISSDGRYFCNIFFDYTKKGSIYYNSNRMGDIQWVQFITTANSTIDSNGFYKKASPIVRLVNPTSQTAIDTCLEDNLQKVGDGFANDQASSAQVKYLAVGHYEVHGSLGFAKSGWYIETPQDANGNKKLFVEYTTDQNNVITVKTYQNCFENGRFVAGELMDIPDGRWIDLRLSMPEISTD